jgi:hypothetical protein
MPEMPRRPRLLSIVFGILIALLLASNPGALNASGSPCAHSLYITSDDAQIAAQVDSQGGDGLRNGLDRLTIRGEDLLLPGTEVDETDEPEAVEQSNGLDLWVLFGSIALFVAIVVAIQLLRRWR